MWAVLQNNQPKYTFIFISDVKGEIWKSKVPTAGYHFSNEMFLLTSFSKAYFTNLTSNFNKHVRNQRRWKDDCLKKQSVDELASKDSFTIPISLQPPKETFSFSFGLFAKNEL